MVFPGWVRNARRLAAPTTSVKVPKLVLPEVTAAIVAVPDFVKLPAASGVPALGRTRTLCQVRAQITPALLALVTVNAIWAAVRDVIAAAVPLASAARSTRLTVRRTPARFSSSRAAFANGPAAAAWSFIARRPGDIAWPATPSPASRGASPCPQAAQ